MSKILMTSYYNSPNTYVKNIVDELSKIHEIICDVNSFWNSNISFDVVHIQWVEELFDWRIVSNKDLEDLRIQLRFWKNNGAKIVITRHNKLPHRKHFLDKQLYDIAYKNADAVVHLGGYSLEELKTRGKNVSISHVNYFDLVETIDNKAARQYINIPKDGNLFLSFGSIRHIDEEQSIIKAFKSIKTKKDYLLICNSLLFNKTPSFRKQPVSRIKHHLKKNRFKRNHIFFKRNRILNSDLKYYLNSANIIISPRLNTLNSGVIYMGFSFSKIVIGPDIGNIGPVLKHLENPVFEPYNICSIAKAMVEAKSLVGTVIEKQNFEYGKTKCSPYEVASKHSQLYKSLLHEW